MLTDEDIKKYCIATQLKPSEENVDYAKRLLLNGESRTILENDGHYRCESTSPISQAQDLYRVKVAAVRCLTKRQIKILACRYFYEFTLRETGDLLGVSYETIRLEEVKLIGRLREELR